MIRDPRVLPFRRESRPNRVEGARAAIAEAGDAVLRLCSRVVRLGVPKVARRLKNALQTILRRKGDAFCIAVAIFGVAWVAWKAFA